MDLEGKGCVLFTAIAPMPNGVHGTKGAIVSAVWKGRREGKRKTFKERS